MGFKERRVASRRIKAAARRKGCGMERCREPKHRLSRPEVRDSSTLDSPRAANFFLPLARGDRAAACAARATAVYQT